MIFSGINMIAVVVATAVGFAAGSVWYMVFGKSWALAQGKEPGSFRPSVGPFLLAVVAQFIMALMLAGVIGHLGAVTLHSAIISAILIWAGFIATTIAVNDSFQGTNVMLTVIDAGHWLVVLMLMGAVIGAFGV
ncbi:MAG: DUF1761 domain-containing protein [Pseudomonadota bacterium]